MLQSHAEDCSLFVQLKMIIQAEESKASVYEAKGHNPCMFLTMETGMP